MEPPIDEQNIPEVPLPSADVVNGDASPDLAEATRAEPLHLEEEKQLPPLLQKLADKVGKIDDSRIVSTPEYLNGEVPRLFSNLQYKTFQHPNGTEVVTVMAAKHSDSSFVSSSALLCGTALGCGLLTLPTAIGSGAGYLPTIFGSLVAWAYMTISALLTSELLINRVGETGRVRNVGLLELYTSYLGDVGGKLAGLGFLVVSYLVMGFYLAEGGCQLTKLLDMAHVGLPGGGILDNHEFVARGLFGAGLGTFLLTASRFKTTQKAVSHFFVPATLLAFVVAMAVGLPTADFGSLVALKNQHPEAVLSTFPLLFMSWTYHGVVPRVVYDLEGDKDKITKAIVGGSTTALLIYLSWIAMILGNSLDGPVLGAGLSLAEPSLNTLRLNPTLQTPVTVVSELAVITSLIGVILGFVNEINDAIWTTPSKAYGPKENNKWKVALLTITPAAFISAALAYFHLDADVNNYGVIDYTGIFGASVLFLILPALMAWEMRYGEEDPPRPLTVRPMVPLGKIPLGSLYKAAGTLIVEQGLEKLGVFGFVKERLVDAGLFV
ncbi:hypothetical protein ACHAXT_000254 [Thalassiosira profunda]